MHQSQRPDIWPELHSPQSREGSRPLSRIGRRLELEGSLLEMLERTQPEVLRRAAEVSLDHQHDGLQHRPRG